MCGCQNKSGFAGATTLGVSSPGNKSSFLGLFESNKVGSKEADQLRAEAAAQGIGLTTYAMNLRMQGNSEKADRVDLLVKQNGDQYNKSQATAENIAGAVNTTLGVISLLKADNSPAGGYTPPAPEPDNTKYWLMGVGGFMVVLIVIVVVVKMRKK